MRLTIEPFFAGGWGHRALRVNYTLTHLVLKSNKIGDPGAEALGLALAQNSALTALDLR